MSGNGISQDGAFERCRNCGAELAPGKEQCPACNATQRDTRAQSPSFGRKVTWAIIGVLLLVVANLYHPYITPYLRPVWPIRFAPLVGEAISRLKRNGDALKPLGSSVQHGWFVRGYIRSFNDELGAAQFRFTVRGSHGIGAVRARLARVEDTWVFSQLIFEPENGAPVNLLNATDDPPREKFTLQKDIYLVPVGVLPDLGLRDLPEFYKNKFGLNIVVLPPIPLEPAVQDDPRGQLIAEEIVTLMQRRLPQLAKNPKAVLVGITNQDMYFRERDWPFTYTYWDGERGGAVSSVRFHSTRDSRDPLLKIRTRKMISRVIGMLALKLPRSEDLSSVLAAELYGSFSADLMSDEFDGLGSLAMIDNFRSAHWLPSFPPKIIAEKTSLDVNRVDGSYPCLLIQRQPDVSSQTPAFISTITKCLPQLLTNRNVDELEIDFRTGRVMTKETDIFLDGIAPLAATRCYHPWDYKSRTFGYNMSLAWDMFPSGKRNPYSEVGLNLCGGHRIDFERISEGSSYMNALFEHRQTATPFLRARFGWAGNGWNLDLTDGTHMFFPESYNGKRGVDGAVVEFNNSKGGAVKIQRDNARNLIGLLRTPSEFLRFDYDSRNRMTRAYDHRNNTVTYRYDLAGRLVQVNTPHSVRRYAYESTDLMSVHHNGEPLFEMRYVRGRIEEISVKRVDRYKFRYDYHPRDDYTVIRTHVTAPDGTTKSFDIQPE